MQSCCKYTAFLQLQHSCDKFFNALNNENDEKYSSKDGHFRDFRKI